MKTIELPEDRADYLTRLIVGVREQIAEDPETIKAKEDYGDEVLIGKWIDAELLCSVVEIDILGLAPDPIHQEG